MPQGDSAYVITYTLLPEEPLVRFGRNALSGAQLCYAESDRPLMDEAWELMTAHKEDLVRRAGGQAAPPRALPAIPRVLAMLRQTE